AIRAAVGEYRQAMAGAPHLICAAVKANANLSLLRRLRQWGCGFDVVSGGELERVLRAGGRADRVVFSGVGKTAEEMDLALRAGILLFQVESEPEMELLAERAARLRRKARFGLRVNPDIAARTHPHIATGLREHKFGLEAAVARRLYLGSRGGKQARWLADSGFGSVHRRGAPGRRAGLRSRAARRRAEIFRRWRRLGRGLCAGAARAQRGRLRAGAAARAARGGRRGGVAHSARTRAAAAGGGGRAADARALRQAPRRPEVCDHRRRRQRLGAP